MRPINFIVTVVLLFVVGTAGMAAQEMQEITPVKAREMVKSGKASLLDVRTQQEWDLGHLEKASRVDVMDKDFKKKIQSLGLDKKKPLIVYCATGGRSAYAADDLIKMGYKVVYNMVGGIKAWQAAGLPIVK